jgi:hypothetical protein
MLERDEPIRNGEPPGAAGVRLHYDAWEQLMLTDAEGKQHAGVTVIQAFPLTDPRHGIAICDGQGRELVWIDDLDNLPTDIQRTLEEDLARRQFMPTIRRIVSVSAPMEPSEWDVETDRGPTRFVLASDDDIRRLSDERALLVDAHGIRYLIPDLRALDATSRRLLERYL